MAPRSERPASFALRLALRALLFTGVIARGFVLAMRQRIYVRYTGLSCITSRIVYLSKRSFIKTLVNDQKHNI